MCCLRATSLTLIFRTRFAVLCDCLPWVNRGREVLWRAWTTSIATKIDPRTCTQPQLCNNSSSPPGPPPRTPLSICCVAKVRPAHQQTARGCLSRANRYASRGESAAPSGHGHACTHRGSGCTLPVHLRDDHCMHGSEPKSVLVRMTQYLQMQCWRSPTCMPGRLPKR